MKGYDLTNQDYGFWHVIELDYEKTKEYNTKYWKCQCQCGTVKSVRQASLRAGTSISCGCFKKIQPKQIYGFLETVERDYDYEKVSSNNNAYWKCKCLKCGKETTVRGADLKSGHTKSCGCYGREMSGKRNLKDLTGQTFEKLTVISQASSTSYGSSKWLCKCECGSELIVFGVNLIKGHTTSCGCNKSSKGESKIKQFLDNNNIPYQAQYSFPDLKDKNKLRFDFAILFKNQPILLIEYQGEQHYSIIEHWGGEEKFKINYQHDQMKRDYCQNKNIPLLEIPYTQFNKIEELIEEALKNFSITF